METTTKPSRITLSHAAWLAEAERRCEGKFRALRFTCPACGHVQSGQDFLDLGMTPDQAATRAGFSCIGRWLPQCRAAFEDGPGPCNYAGGGLFRIGPVQVVFEEGKEPLWAFDFADDALTSREAQRADKEVPSG